MQSANQALSRNKKEPEIENKLLGWIVPNATEISMCRIEYEV